MTYRMTWTLKEQKQTTHYARGHLLSPNPMDVTSQALQIELGEELKGNWLMCGVGSETMYRLAKQAPKELREGWARFMDSDRRQFVVLAHQAGGAQHRLLIPVWDRRLPAIMEAMNGSHLKLVLQRPGTSQTLLIAVKPNKSFGHEVRLAFQPLDDRQRADAAAALSGLLDSLGQAHAVPSLIRGQKVTEVSVSVVMEGFVSASLAAQAMGVEPGA